MDTLERAVQTHAGQAHVAVRYYHCDPGELFLTLRQLYFPRIMLAYEVIGRYEETDLKIYFSIQEIFRFLLCIQLKLSEVTRSNKAQINIW